MAVHHRRSPPPPPPRRTLPPPLQAKVGKSEIHNGENLIGPFLLHKLLGPNPPLLMLPCPHSHLALTSPQKQNNPQEHMSRPACASGTTKTMREPNLVLLCRRP